jgi:hypothetical protein
LIFVGGRVFGSPPRVTSLGFGPEHDVIDPPL